jgi:hypothetical protein
MIDSLITGVERFVLLWRSEWDRSLVTATGCEQDGRRSIPDTGKIFLFTLPKTVFARSNTEIVGSNPTVGIDVCVCSVCVILCLPCVEAGKNTCTVIPASRKRRQKGNRISLR